jgi:hypothetical protein
VLPLVFESCNATWIFDTDAMRFRRVLKGIEVEGHAVVTEWRPFYGLEFDETSETFRVLLNAEGTKLIQSWRHTHDCTQCGGHVTAELSREELRAAIV